MRSLRPIPLLASVGILVALSACSSSAPVKPGASAAATVMEGTRVATQATSAVALVSTATPLLGIPARTSAPALTPRPTASPTPVPPAASVEVVWVGIDSLKDMTFVGLSRMQRLVGQQCADESTTGDHRGASEANRTNACTNRCFSTLDTDADPDAASNAPNAVSGLEYPPGALSGWLLSASASRESVIH